MKIAIFSTTIILLLFVNSRSYGQLNTILKLFIKQKEKVIYIETKGTELQKIITIEKPKTNDFINDEFAKNKNVLSHGDYENLIKKGLREGKITNAEAAELRYDQLLKSLATSDPKNYKLPIEVEKRIWEEFDKKTRIFHDKLATNLRNVDKAKVFLSIPSNEMEFKNIFKDYNKVQCDEAVELKTFLQNEKNKNVDFPSSRIEIFRLLSSYDEKEKPFIIIGHNEEGAIYFPDGSKSNLKEIDSIAKRFSRVIIYLSCNANQYTTNPAASYFLTYEEAVRLTNRLNKNIPNPPYSSEQFKQIFQRILDNYKKEKELKFKLKVIKYAVSASAVGYGVYEIRSEKE